jgi:hypothetical protein
MRQQGFENTVCFPTREQLYRHIGSQVQEPATYLEFGVFQGESLRCWTGLLPHSTTRFYGFDSFEGLPENWRMAAGKSTFDLKGEMPVFSDARVKLVKGWFTNTLPEFLTGFAPSPNLIVHLDADIYSSTIFVLDQLVPRLKTGTILIFDEFFDRDHELRALEEFTKRTRMQLECIGATEAFTQVAFRVKTPPNV